jgi:hypothetical protein
MNTYKIIFAYPGDDIKTYKYITVEAKSEGTARLEARKKLNEMDSRFANIYAAQKQN